MNLLFADAFAASKEKAAETVALKDSPIADETIAAQVDPQHFVTQNILFLFLLFLIFYFILIRPQQKRIKAHQEMIGALQKGSKVITAGGIIGTVTALEGDDIAVVEIAPSVKVKVTRGTIQELVKPTAAKTANDN